MTEPIYDYVKGQGWVLKPPYLQSEVFSLQSGERVRLIHRKPEVGEYYDSASTRSRRYFNEDDTPKMDVWVTIYLNSRFENLCVWDSNDYDGLGYLTIEVLDG